MDDKKIHKIKEAVKGNFETSPDIYQSFEDRSSFFRELNRVLLWGMKVPAAADILDVGCGTGASSRQLLEDIPQCRVWGLDNSPAMLRKAEVFQQPGRLCFVEGDASRLSEYFDFRFDAIFYSASIFLIPDYKESLNQALSMLKDEGCVGITFLDGVYSNGHNLFQVAEREAQLGLSLKKPVMLSELKTFFGQLFPWHKSWIHDFGLTEEFLREFYSVPAMSAGLFPGKPYDERLENVKKLFDWMPRDKNPLFRWEFMVGERR
jgi:ubiquinone/menaquinone biosynthesis C-methylase UbiE